MRPHDHCWVCSVWGRTITSDIACDQSEEDRLAREVDDPTAILTQLQFQDLYTPRNLQTYAQTNTIQLRPIIPVAEDITGQFFYGDPGRSIGRNADESLPRPTHRKSMTFQRLNR